MIHFSPRRASTCQILAKLEIPSAKATTFQYPHAIEHDGHLLIVFSQKKERSEVLKVPLTQIEALRK